MWKMMLLSVPLLRFSLLLFFLDVKFQVLSGKIIVCQYYSFLSTSSAVHPPSRIVSFLRRRSCPDLYSLIRPPGRPLALGRGRILI